MWVEAPVANSPEMGRAGADPGWCAVYPADNADPVSRRDPHFMGCAAADRLAWQWVGMAEEGMAAEGMAATGSATLRNLIPESLGSAKWVISAVQCCGRVYSGCP
jgi:hypothetical protein